jgi:hypothetical protein
VVVDDLRPELVPVKIGERDTGSSIWEAGPGPAKPSWTNGNERYPQRGELADRIDPGRLPAP